MTEIWSGKLALRQYCVLTVAILALELTGCGGDDGGSASPTRAPESQGLNVTAILDRQTGAIVFPVDIYSVGSEEGNIVASAGTYAAVGCFTEAGYSYHPYDPSWSPLYDASNFFGVWTGAVAERFAFVSPMTEGDMRANGITVNGEPIPESTTPPEPWQSNDLNGPEAEVAINACAETAEVQRFTFEYESAVWGPEVAVADDLAEQSQEWKDALGEYHQCLRDKGIEPDLRDDQLSVIGEDASVINAEQIALALEVVECKDEVRLVERLAGQMAKFQAPVIEKYAVEMVAFRESIDAIVADAKGYLASQGVVSE